MKSFWSSAIGFLFLTLVPAAFAGSPFTIMTEANPPFNFEQEGEVHGIGVDLLLGVMDKTGQPIPRSAIEIIPWPRAYEAVQNQPGTMLFSMARTEQRENLFAWVGPLFDLDIGLIAPKQKKIVINTIADAEKYKIGTIREGAPEQLVIQAGFSPDTLDRIADPRLNIKKLAAGRIDMFAFNVPAAFYMMRQQGLNPKDYEVVYTLKQTGLYYAFHKDTDPNLITNLNQALTELKKKDADGRSPYQEIIANYLGAD